MAAVQDSFEKTATQDAFDTKTNVSYEGSTDVALVANPFDSESSRILFDAIDQLQSCDAGQDIDIPQLVIVGGQSTGKSSLLRSLVDIPFPTGQGCCTRFATRIISRRTAPGSKNECVITIVKPDFDLNEHFQYGTSTGYENYRHHCEILSSEEFKRVMEEVEEKYMGIRPGKSQGAKNFATEVLKVELSGPKRSHFSILDIPGIFSNPKDVNVAEMGGVTRMVTEYLKKPQNLVICVADAGHDLANQGVFTLAAEHVEKSRLIGVFTKCDNVRDSTEARQVVKVATEPQGSSEANSMQHGWFVVRNRRAGEGNHFDLSVAENELFRKQPWTEIPASRRGSSELKKFLGNLLCSRIRQEFPYLQTKVKDLLEDAVAARAALGSPRLSHSDRQRYLTDIAQRFQEAAKYALNSPGRLPLQEMRVRGFVAAKNREFDSKMRENGHWFDFEDVIDGSAIETAEKSHQDQDQDQNQSLMFHVGDQPLTPAASPSPKSRNKRQTRSPLKSLTPEMAEPSQIRNEIRQQINIFQSNGLPGLLNIDIFPVLYRTQTQKWLVIATEHLQTIADDVLVAAIRILSHVEQRHPLSPHAREGIMDIIQEFHMTAHQMAKKSLTDYMEKEANFPLQATNPAFVQELEVLRMRRAQIASLRHRHILENWLELNKPGLTIPQVMVQIDHMIRDLNSDPATRMENEVHDVLKVHYELCLQSFIDHTTKRAVEDFISGTMGPLLGLSTKYVLDLSEAEVKILAREDEITLLKRKRYDEKIDRLERSCAIAELAWKRTTPRQGEILAA